MNLSWYEAEIYKFYWINSAWMDSAVFNYKNLQKFYLTFITYKKSDLPNGPEYLHYTINVSKSLSLGIANYLV